MGVVPIGSFLSVLFGVTAVVGGSTWLAGVVGGAIIMGVVAARVPLPIGLAIKALLYGSGLGGYLLAIPDLYGVLSSLQLLRDFVALLAGDMALLQIDRADLWAVLMAPAPVYGTWYLR